MLLASALAAMAGALLLALFNPYIGIFALFDGVALFIVVVGAIIAGVHGHRLDADGRGAGGAPGWASAYALRMAAVIARICAILSATVFAGAEGLVMLVLRQQGRYALPVELIPSDVAQTISLVLFAGRLLAGVVAAVLLWRLSGRWLRRARSYRTDG